MSTRSIVCSLGALLLAACGGGGGGGTGARTDEALAGDILKISYFRVNPEPKTKRPEPTYRVVMSEGWRQAMGEGPREPFAKAAPNKVFKGFANDPVMAKYIRELRGLGLDKLRYQNPDDGNPTDLYQKAMGPKGDLQRIITVGSDKGAKSYYFSDQTEEQARIFIKCEILASAIMDGHTLSVRVVTPRTAVPEK